MEKPELQNRVEYETYLTTWQWIDLEIRHCSCWLSSAEDDFVTQHIEIRSEGKVPLPITRTGYRSHFENGADALNEFGDDPIEFVLWLLTEAAKDLTWKRKEEDRRQGTLF